MASELQTNHVVRQFMSEPSSRTFFAIPYWNLVAINFIYSA